MIKQSGQNCLAAVQRRTTGFTLVELAVVMFIMALALGSILIPVASQVEQHQIGETQKTMEEIRDALLGFAAANGHLPCPDLQAGGVLPFNDGAEDPNDGREDANAAGACTAIAADASASGNVPWLTLGLGQQDAWGNRFRYIVHEMYARRSPAAPLASLATTAGLQVCNAATCPIGTTLTSTAIAVIISHGKNGLGAVNATTNLANPAATRADEIENSDNTGNTVSRTQSNIAGAEFDDIVVWLPKFIFNNRMIASGKLP